MKKRIDLTSGNIFKTLIALSLPILGTSFIQMAYNMIDMIWIGRVGSDAVAAVGTAGFFPWFAMSLVFICKIGAEVGISQSIGRGDYEARDKFIKNSIILNIILSLSYGLALILFRNQLIGFFNLGDKNIINMAIQYLVIVAIGMPFYFINPIFTSIFNASGNSKTPFMVNTIGLVFNLVFDPLFIFGVGPIPALGVAGAAIATVMAQIVVTVIFMIAYKRNGYHFGRHIFKEYDKNIVKKIVKVGLPTALQEGCFSIFAMIIGRYIAQWGSTAIAVQKVGSQIEAISWMTAGGFSTALTTFVGQNYGAKKWDRIFKGYGATLVLSASIGVFATVLFVFFGDMVFSVFIPEEEAIKQGIEYLKILGYSQLFMCLEITTAGTFNGLGKTIIPSAVGITLTGMRVPAVILIASIGTIGINGVWWSISITSMLKGVLLVSLFYFIIYKKKRVDKLEEIS
ncbi:MAG: MATE family efflux transporter [Clostridium sp.]